MLLHIVADYGYGDLAFAEVVQRIRTHLPDAEPVLTPVPPFATLAAGFCIGQLGLNVAPPGTIVYHNVAPRQDDAAAREENAGEALTYVRLPSGVRVIGVNAGHALSFVRDVAEELRLAAAPDAGSQFRSRDLFPQAAAAIALGELDALGDELVRTSVPDVPDGRIAYVDGYGNLKTTVRADASGVEEDAAVLIRVGDRALEATATPGTFAVEDGDIAFAPGSSGWTLPDGTEVRFMEVFLRGGNAWEAFGRPPIATELTIERR